MMHIAIVEALSGKNVTWMMKLTGEEDLASGKRDQAMPYLIVNLRPGKSDEQSA